MSKSRKPLKSIQDSDVSIFDSQQQQTTPKPKIQEKNKEKLKTANRNSNKQKTDSRKLTKAKQKQMMKDEAEIMRQLNKVNQFNKQQIKFNNNAQELQKNKNTAIFDMQNKDKQYRNDDELSDLNLQIEKYDQKQSMNSKFSYNNPNKPTRKYNKKNQNISKYSIHQDFTTFSSALQNNNYEQYSNSLPPQYYNQVGNYQQPIAYSYNSPINFNSYNNHIIQPFTNMPYNHIENNSNMNNILQNQNLSSTNSQYNQARPKIARLGPGRPPKNNKPPFQFPKSPIYGNYPFIIQKIDKDQVQTQKPNSFNTNKPIQNKAVKKTPLMIKQQIPESIKKKIAQKIPKQQRNRKRKLLAEQIQKLKKQYDQLQNQIQQQTNNNNNKLNNQQLTQQQINLYKNWTFKPIVIKQIQNLQVVNNASNPYQKSKTQGRINLIAKVLDQNPFLTQYQLAEVLKVLDPAMNSKIQRSVVLRLLKMGGFKKKKVLIRQQDIQYQKKQKQFYSKKIIQYRKQNVDIYYYDELIINEYFDKQSGWCHGTQQIQYKPQQYINKSLVALVVMSKQGICKWDIKFDNYDDQLFCKTLNCMLKSFQQQTLENRVLVVNPLSYRKSHYFHQITKRRGWELQLMPINNKGINPLNSYFIQIKQILRKYKFQTLQKMYEKTVEIIKQCQKNAYGSKIIPSIQAFLQK